MPRPCVAQHTQLTRLHPEHPVSAQLHTPCMSRDSFPQVVVDTLYAGPPDGSSSGHGSGHTFLRETVQAIVAGIRNPAHQQLSISAVQLLGGCGVRLAAYEDAGGKEEAPAAAVAAAPGGVDLGG